METINFQNEATLLGYFESCRCTFLAKKIMIDSLTIIKDGVLSIDSAKLSNVAINDASSQYVDEISYKAILQENEEIYLNLQEDLLTAFVTSSWNVFELLIKDIPNRNYSIDNRVYNADFYRNVFGLSNSEIENVKLFYYLRNAIVHYNGAYFRAKDIDHNYMGSLFRSAGNEGDKIQMEFAQAWSMSKDLEKYAMRCWNNVRNQP